MNSVGRKTVKPVKNVYIICICYRASHSTAIVFIRFVPEKCHHFNRATKLKKKKKETGRERQRERGNEKQCAIQTYIGFCHGKIRFNLMEREKKIRNKIKHSKTQ